MSCEAIVFDGPGLPLRCTPFTPPTLAPGEAWVRVTTCTVCGSDLHSYFGHRSQATPTILGHEIVGVVEAIGPGAAPRTIDEQPIVIGDRVTWSVVVACGHCEYCDRGLVQKCTALFKYGKQVLTATEPPRGGLSTHCHLLPRTAIMKVPTLLPDEVAAPGMCATATVMAAIREMNWLSRRSPQRVLIIGAGLLGLTACAVAAVQGIPTIAIVDPNPDRVELARQFGATHPIAIVSRLELRSTEPLSRGVDAVIELSGAELSLPMAFESVRTGGVIVLVGSVSPTQPVPVQPEALVRNCLRISGVHNYTPIDLLDAIRFLELHHARFPFAQLVDRSFPLHHAAEAFEYAHTHRPIRVAVHPS